MAIAAQLEEAHESGSRRQEGRLRLHLEALGTLPKGNATSVLVHNVSESGLLLESRVALSVGDEIAVDLPHAGICAARVIWASEHLFGCQFDHPISQATLSAAQLRSAVTPVPDPVVVPSAPAALALTPEPLGQRLRKLRLDRGFTLDHLASGLGVSKPTVWAWEQGKARPAAHRLDALAQILGVARTELTATRNMAATDTLVARARSQLAEALGLDPLRIRIMIEL